MGSNIETIIYCFIDLLCIGNSYIMVTCYVSTPFVSLLLNYMPYYIFCLVDIHVTFTMSSLQYFLLKHTTTN
jgi:hypothetical protein